MNKKCAACRYHCRRCDEIEKRRPPDLHTGNDTLCWCCKHAVPMKDKDGQFICGCPWSIDREPVPGWEYSAKSVYRSANGKEKMVSYGITKCPLFERG